MAPTSLTFNVINPGSSARRVSTEQVPIYFGVAETGDDGVIKSVGRYSDAAEDLTRGHLLDEIAAAFAGGADTVHYCKLLASTAGSVGEQVATAEGDGTVALSGTYSQRLRVAVQIGDAGGNGEATFRVSLDYFEIAGIDPTWGPWTTVPADGTHTIDGTAIVVTFDDAAGDFAAGDLFVQDVYPGMYGATEIAACGDVVRESAPADATALVFTGEHAPGVANAGATSAATNLSAICSLVSSLFATADFFGALAGCSEASDASVVAATSAIVATPPFVSAGYGKGYVTNPVAAPGRGLLALSQVDAVSAARIFAGGDAGLISSDPGRTASGALPRVVATNYDSRLEGTALEVARISTFTTYQRRLSPGVFVKRQRLLDSAVGDFYSWQDAAIMIAALRAVHPVAWLALLEGFRQNADGTLDASEIAGLKSACDRALGMALLQPTNARGLPGHVTAASATPSRTEVLPRLRVDFRIRRLGYAEDLTFALQYAGEV